MSEELANAGTAPAADSSFSGGQGSGEQSSEPTGIRAAYEAAKAEVDGTDKKRAEKPKGDAQKAVSDKVLGDRGKGLPDAKAQPKPSGEPKPKTQPAQAAEPAETVEAPKAPAVKAPERWPAEWKATYEQLPPEGQKLMLDQHRGWERGYNQKFEEFAHTRKQLDAVTAAIPEGMRQTMQQRGIEAPAVISRLFALQQQSEADPLGFIADFMQRAKIDPRALAQRLSMPQQQLSPALIAPLVQPLQEKIARLEAAEAERMNSQRSERNKALEAAFASFMQETDESGESAHPHLERVADHVVAYLEANATRLAPLEPRQRLEEAYNYAVYADPTLRDEIVSAKAAARAEALEQERYNGRVGKSATAKPRASSSAPAPRSKGMRGAFEAAKKDLGAGH